MGELKVAALRLSEIATGEMKEIKAGETTVLLARVDERLKGMPTLAELNAGRADPSKVPAAIGNSLAQAMP